MKNLFAIIALVSLLSCGNDAELRKTVSIPDTQFPELPQYSEWGYNTFGAYYGRQPFVSNDNEVPLNITRHDNVAVHENSAAFKATQPRHQKARVGELCETPPRHRQAIEN